MTTMVENGQPAVRLLARLWIAFCQVGSPVLAGAPSPGKAC
jgi:hypothetical protein